jgi:hypothetical protein
LQFSPKRAPENLNTIIIMYHSLYVKTERIHSTTKIPKKSLPAYVTLAQIFVRSRLLN